MLSSASLCFLRARWIRSRWDWPDAALWLCGSSQRANVHGSPIRAQQVWQAEMAMICGLESWRYMVAPAFGGSFCVSWGVVGVKGAVQLIYGFARIGDSHTGCYLSGSFSRFARCLRSRSVWYFIARARRLALARSLPLHKTIEM